MVKRHFFIIFILLTSLMVLRPQPLLAAKNNTEGINQIRLAPLDLNNPAIKSIIQNIKKSAITGDANAQYSLGALYYTGQLIDKNKTQALKWFKKAADQGEPTAQFYLGKMYLNGTGVDKNKKTGINWLKKSAKQGEKQAVAKLTKMGVKFAKKQRPVKKKKIQKKKKRIASSSNRESGSGAPQTAQNKNLSQAEEYMLRGIQYKKGDRVPQDDVQSFKWIKKAADLGLPSAQLVLGGYYLKGEGVAQDREKGIELIALSAENGYQPAGQVMLQLIIYIDPEQKGRDGNLSFKAYKKIALNGNVNAQFNLGKIYVNGWGVDENARKAAIWFKRAADQGHGDAALNLSVLYFAGNGVKKDDDQGLMWLNKAIELGSEKAIDLFNEIKSGRST